MLLAAITEVECVNGCGSGGDVSALGMIGLAVALISMALAVYAVKLSKQSADSARNSLGIAEEQHAVFLQQRDARAEFELSIYLDRYPPTKVIETTEDEVRLKWNMGIQNVGSKVASRVGVNLLIPSSLTNFHWTDQTGRFVLSNPTQLLQTSEELPAGDGSSEPSQYLVETLDTVDLTTSQVCFASATVESPPPGQERTVPVKFKVWSDDLTPNEQGERARYEILETTIRRVRPPAIGRPA